MKIELKKNIPFSSVLNKKIVLIVTIKHTAKGGPRG